MAVFINIRDYQEQLNLRRNRIFRDRLHPLDAYNDREIIRRYRLSRPLILELYDEIAHEIEPQSLRSHAIPGILKLFCVLRFCATGTFQAVIGDSIGIHKSSVSRIVARVTTALSTLRNEYIKFPVREADMARTKQRFYDIAQFPRVIGAIDGTLINIKKPTENENLFISRKGVHCLNVLAVCSSDLLFTYIVAKFPGANNDSFIWNYCNLQERFEAGDFRNSLLLGDSGYALSRYLLTPVQHPTSQAEEQYNASHKQTRQVIERSFGLLKQRFRCLDRSGGYLTYEPGKCCKIVVTCCILHNICVRNNLPVEDEDCGEDSDDDEAHSNDENEGNENALQQENAVDAADGLQLRRNLINQCF